MVSKQLLQCLDISNVNIPFWSIVIAGEQGWHNGESTRLMARVQIQVSTPLVVSSLLREISLRILRFSPLLKPTLLNSNSIWNARTRSNEFSRTPKCFAGKQSTIYGLQFIFTIMPANCASDSMTTNSIHL